MLARPVPELNKTVRIIQLKEKLQRNLYQEDSWTVSDSIYLIMGFVWLYDKLWHIPKHLKLVNISLLGFFPIGINISLSLSLSLSRCFCLHKNNFTMP